MQCMITEKQMLELIFNNRKVIINIIFKCKFTFNKKVKMFIFIVSGGMLCYLILLSVT